MPTLWDTYPIKFEGGLMTNQGRLEQGGAFPGSATVLQNFETDIKGGYTKILGYNKFSESVVPNSGVVKGVFAPVNSTVVAFRGDGAFISTGTAWTRILTIPSITYQKIYYDRYDFGVGENYVVVDGVNYPSFYEVSSGTMAYGVGFPTDVLGASYVKFFKEHLFYAVGKNLVFSAPFTDDDFAPANGAGIINIGYEITGLSAFREQLFIFCTDKIYRLSGNTLADFQILPVTYNTGCISGHTIQEVGGDIMYLSNDGIRYLSASERMDDFGLTRASEKVQSELVSWIKPNASFASITIAPKNQYRIFLYKDSTSIDKSKGFIGVKFSNQSAEDISWSTTVGFKVYSTAKFASDVLDEYFFSNETDYVYRMESGGTFDGTSITSIFETPYLSITDPKIRKTLYKHSLYTRGGQVDNLALQVLFDYNVPGTLQPDPIYLSSGGTPSLYDDPGTLYGTAIYGQSSSIQLYNNLVGSGFVAALRYTGVSSGEPFNLNYSILEYKNNERR